MSHTAKGHECAVALIRNYVERGDDVDQFRKGGLGVSCTEYSASIGGCEEYKKYPNTKILVTRIDGIDTLEVFCLYEIWNEVLQEKKQPTLL